MTKYIVNRRQVPLMVKKCNLCDMIIKGGGICRFMFHIVGGDKNLAICINQGKEVKRFFLCNDG